MAENPPKTEADIRTLIENAAKELGLTLQKNKLESLIDLLIN